MTNSFGKKLANMKANDENDRKKNGIKLFKFNLFSHLQLLTF